MMTNIATEAIIDGLKKDWPVISETIIARQALDLYRRCMETRHKKDLRAAHLEAMYELIRLTMNVINLLAEAKS